MTPYRAIPRSVRELILRDLARQTRTAKTIADRHHVHVDAVTALRSDFGPGPVELLAAAEELARPAKLAPTPAAAPPALDAVDRKACRTWALTTGRTTAGTGPLPHAIVTAWIEAGRPVAEAPKPASGPVVQPTAEEDSAEPYCTTCSDVGAFVVDGRVVVCACASELLDDEDDLVDEPEPEPGPEPIAAQEQQPDDDVIDAPIVCGTCGEPLPEPWDDSCPSCGELFAPAVAGATPEQVTEKGEQPPAPWHDWPALMERAEGVPAVVREWDMVIQHVEMLRDALAEHEHHQAMVERVAKFLDRHQHLGTMALAAAILDEIEAA